MDGAPSVPAGGQEVVAAAAGASPAGRRTTVLLLLLSTVAGSTDAIGFLGLDLFTSHITGNIVVLTSHLAAQGTASISHLIAVPVFMMVLGMARLLGLAIDRRREGVSPGALLMLQFAFLLAFLLAGVSLDLPIDTAAPPAILAAMCGVAAMAVQNALVQASMPGVPSTAVLTTNVTRFTVSMVEGFAGPTQKRQAARDRARATFLPIAGFVAGCAAGSFLEWHFGLSALLLPVLASLGAVVVHLSSREA